jgi:hypothetical protein
MVEGSVAVTNRQRKKITRVYMCLSFHILKNLYTFYKRNTGYQVQSQDENPKLTVGTEFILPHSLSVGHTVKPLATPKKT